MISYEKNIETELLKKITLFLFIQYQFFNLWIKLVLSTNKTFSGASLRKFNLRIRFYNKKFSNKIKYFRKNIIIFFLNQG